MPRLRCVEPMGQARLGSLLVQRVRQHADVLLPHRLTPAVAVAVTLRTDGAPFDPVSERDHREIEGRSARANDAADRRVSAQSLEAGCRSGRRFESACEDHCAQIPHVETRNTTSSKPIRARREARNAMSGEPGQG